VQDEVLRTTRRNHVWARVEDSTGGESPPWPRSRAGEEQAETETAPATATATATESETAAGCLRIASRVSGGRPRHVAPASLEGPHVAATHLKRGRLTMNKFVAQQVATQLVRSLRPVVEQILGMTLACRMKEAGSSILLNIAEGNRRNGRDRLHLFHISAGRTGEVDAILDVAIAWGYVAEREVIDQRALLDRQLGLLRGLTHKRA
jgi:four helix bundle protein